MHGCRQNFAWIYWDRIGFHAPKTQKLSRPAHWIIRNKNPPLCALLNDQPALFIREYFRNRSHGSVVLTEQEHTQHRQDQTEKDAEKNDHAHSLHPVA
jgi:hypothetical protein